MDDELKELASHALKNAFWADFSALCNAYLDASEGVADRQDLEMEMGDKTSIYGRDCDAESTDLQLNIWTQNKNGWNNGWNTISQALEYPEAIEVHLRGVKIFERVEGEWRYCGE
jgi:hypothetical protein